MNAVAAKSLVPIARTWVKVPFAHYGRSRDGVDCVGLIISVLREAGAVADDFCSDIGNYEVAPFGSFVRRQVKDRATPLPTPVPGSLVLFRCIERGWPVSLALACENSFVIAVPKRGVIERRPNQMTARLLHSAWALPGVDYTR